MNIFRNKTLVVVLYHVGEQALRSYLHWRSAKNLGPEQQKHEMTKDSISLGRNIIKSCVMASVYQLDNLVIKK